MNVGGGISAASPDTKCPGQQQVAFVVFVQEAQCCLGVCVCVHYTHARTRPVWSATDPGLHPRQINCQIPHVIWDLLFRHQQLPAEYKVIVGISAGNSPVTGGAILLSMLILKALILSLMGFFSS